MTYQELIEKMKKDLAHPLFDAVAFPANPFEGQVEYMFGGPMGSGWYVYRNGQWIVDESGYFDGSPPPLNWGQCECGAEKAKQPGHSDWCPKYRSGG